MHGASRILVACGLSVVLGVACGSPAPPPPPQAPAPEARFDAQRAWADLLALTAVGPRAAGTPGAAAARDYLRGQLEGLGLAVIEQAFDLAPPQDRAKAPPLEADAGAAEPAGEPARMDAAQGVNLRVVIPGQSPDLVILLAAYDTPPGVEPPTVGANGSASGAALLLELARVLSAQPLPYTTWLVWVDAEAPPGDPQLPGARRGSRALARMLLEEQRTDRVRIAVAFSQVGDADLRIERDLLSLRRYREMFWEVARERGRREAFPADTAAATVDAAHISMFEAGIRNVVALADVRYGGTEPPGTFANSAQDTPDHCAAESLGTVGEVTLAGLEKITALLRKVDRFAKTRESGEPDATPQAPGSPEGPSMPDGSDVSPDASPEDDESS